MRVGEEEKRAGYLILSRLAWCPVSRIARILVSLLTTPTMIWPCAFALSPN